MPVTPARPGKLLPGKLAGAKKAAMPATIELQLAGTGTEPPKPNKTADWLHDFGPEGGDGGGRIVAHGTPEDVAADAESWTGRYLKVLLERHEARRLERVAALKKKKRA